MALTRVATAAVWLIRESFCPSASVPAGVRQELRIFAVVDVSSTHLDFREKARRHLHWERKGVPQRTVGRVREIE